MGILEIVLIAVGAVILLLGYALPAKRKENEISAPQVDAEQVKKLVEEEVDHARAQIRDIVDETVTYSMEKTERAMERLTNEKIMAVNEYSDTVLETINKNHKEAVFLYDMLNDKHEELVTSVGTASQTVKEIRATLSDLTTEGTGASGKAGGKKTQKNASGTASTGTGKTGRTKTAPVSKKEDTAAPEPEFTPISPERVTVIGGVAVENGTQGAAELPEIDVAFAGKEENNNERILKLHKEGKSKTAIARELGLGVGEVKLVIDLFEGVD